MHPPRSSVSLCFHCVKLQAHSDAMSLQHTELFSFVLFVCFLLSTDVLIVLYCTEKWVQRTVRSYPAFLVSADMPEGYCSNLSDLLNFTFPTHSIHNPQGAFPVPELTRSSSFFYNPCPVSLPLQLKPSLLNGASGLPLHWQPHVSTLMCSAHLPEYSLLAPFQAATHHPACSRTECSFLLFCLLNVCLAPVLISAPTLDAISILPELPCTVPVLCPPN